MIAAVRDGEMDGRTGYTIAKNLGVDSVGAEWRAAQDVAMRLADEMGYEELLTVAHAVRVAAAKRGWTGSRREIDDAIAEGRRKAGATADREPVETGDGRMLTVGEVEAEMGKGRGEVEAPGGAANGGATAIFDAAARTSENRGVDLVAREDGSFGVARWPKARIEVSAEGIRIDGLRIEDLTGEGNLADAAAFVARVRGLAEKTGKGVLVGDADVAEALRLIEGEIRREGMEVYGAERMAEFGRLVERLSESLPTAKVTHDAASFEAAMTEAGTRAWRDSKYETYGCVTKDGRICLNPLVVDFDTPLHEYGHLALDVARNANAALVERGLKLARASEEYRRIAEDPVYAKQGEAAMAEEALVHLIAARGEALVKERGIGEKLKAWLSEFWKSFGDAVGIRDLTGEQISRMTMADVADAIGSEMLGGREFGSARAERGAARLEAGAGEEARRIVEGGGDGAGEARRTVEGGGAGAFVRIGERGAEVVRPTRKAVKGRTRKPFGVEAYDESQESGRNGLLRWAKDNDGLLRIPIDRERTVPGGEVKFKADDANVTDWIIRRLNGRRLVLTKNGAIALKGRNGKVEFPTGELRDLFGAKFKEGSNDGLGEKLAAELGEARWGRATIEEIADALGKDRRNYAAWVERQKAVRRGERPATDEERYYMEQAEREEAFRREEVAAGGERYRGEDLLDAEAAKASAAWEEADYDRWVASEVAAGRFKRGRESVRKISKEGVERSKANAALAVLKGKEYVNRSTGIRARLSTAGVNKMLSNAAVGKSVANGFTRSQHNALAAEIDRLYEDSYLVESRADRSGDANVRSIKRFVCPVEIGETEAGAYITVKESVEHGNRIYSVEGIKIAALPPTMKRVISDHNSADNAATGGSIANGLAARQVAAEEDAAYLDAVRRGDAETAKRLLRTAWERSGYASEQGYRGSHAAPGASVGRGEFEDIGRLTRANEAGESVNLWGIANGISPVPEGFFTAEGYRRYGHADKSSEEARTAVAAAMDKVRSGNGEATITVYRAVPKGVRADALQSGGQWVSPSRTYAEEHGAANLNGDYRIIEQKVRAADLWWDGNDIREWGYDDGRQYVYRDGANGMKLATVTYDDAGEVIPLSRRFDTRNEDVRFGRSGVTESVFRYAPTKGAEAIGETEGNGAGIAGGEEKSAALRPWTRAGSPCAEAKPIAFDAADLLQFWRRVVDGGRFRVAKGEHVPGRRNAVGVNAGGKDITVAARLFGMFDAGDRARLKEELKGRGFWRNEDLEWCAGATKEAIAAERARSEAKLDEEIGRLVKERVLMGKGGEHYAAEVMAHEIAHTLAKMPGGDLGPTMNAAKTLLDEMSGALRKGEGAADVKAETARLIAWWHGTKEMPSYYRRDSERFAEVFGIFLTQPEGVKARSPRVYEICRELLSKNQRAWSAYHEICSEKWSGTSNERILREIERTWDGEFAARAARLNADMNAGSWKKVDELNYALNDRYGPMFALGMRNVKAERKRLAGEVAAGRMTQGEADARIGSMERTVTALRSGLYDLQRLEGGEARLMVSGFNDVIEGAVKDGVNWTDVRRYAHLMRVIEIGGRATAHGVDPSRAAAMLDEMSARLGEEGYGRVEETWKKFRAVYERFVLDDARVQRMFDGQTNAMLRRNAHYVTMRHTVGVEDLADYERRVKEFEATGRGDPTEFMTAKIVRGLSGIDGRDGVYKLHRLTGSVDATTDPIVATVKKAVEIKRAAVRNELVRSLAKMVTECGVKDSLDGAARTVENERFGTLAYLEDGQTRRLVVPKIIAKSFTAKTGGELREFGAAMRALRNTMTLWNPAFINRAYLLDKAALETNLKGMHKSAVDVIAGAIPFARLPNYAMDNYLARFTGFTKTWLGRLLYNEHTVNYYVRDAQKIADIVYKGRFGEEARRAAELRKAGDTSGAAEIEERLGVAQQMLRRNVFQSSWEFNKLQSAATVGDVAHAFGLEQSAADAKGWRGAVKKAGRAYNRYEEEQEAVTKIVAWLYDAKTNPNRDADARARLVIEQGGTPNLSARGVLATHIENATGFFWNVRKEATLRTWRAFRDHPQEWAAKAVAQTVLPAVMKGFAVMGGLKWLFLNYVFDNDEKRLQQSALAPVINYYEWMGRALRNVPGYQQRNYNVIPLWTPPEGGTFALRIKYAPEEFAAVNAVHAAMNAWMPDPTDPDANIDTALQSMRTELLPDLLGDNPAAMLVSAVLNPIFGENVHDNFRGRDIYSDDAIVARWTAPKYLAAEMARNVVNYSPIGSLVAAIPDPNDKMREVETPGALDVLLNKVPVLSKIPASCLGFWATPSRTGAIAGAKRLDDQYRAKARLIASDVLAKCVQRGTLAGADADIGKVDQTTRSLVYESLMRGWRAYWRDAALDERSRAYKVVKNLKYPAARAIAERALRSAYETED